MSTEELRFSLDLNVHIPDPESSCFVHGKSRSQILSSWNSLLGQFESNPQVHLVISLAALLLFAGLAHFLIKVVIRRVLKLVAPRFGEIPSEFVQDDVLFGRLALLIPVLLIHQGIGLLSDVSGSLMRFVQKLMVITTILIGMSLVSRFLGKGNEIYGRYPVSRSRPVKGYIQIAVIIMYIMGFVLCIATLLDKSPLVFVSGLGAMTAIILLVFRDTLLSLVAGIQLTTNNLIRVGDWIEIPQFGADGDVIDIALHTVKVQNWDKTITTIPTHKFLENSFKNWRGMSESGGRRIKRSLQIDLNSIRFLTDEEIQKFSGFALLRSYLQEKQTEIDAYNREKIGGEVLVANARRMTNIGVFRAYLERYLRQHPGIHQNMTFLIRQLQPTAEGLPLEIYVFTKDVRWAYYESIQADVFDHIFAVVREFGLSLYQKPSGIDLRQMEITRGLQTT